MSVKSEGAGSLFEKVELEDEGEESKKNQKKLDQSKKAEDNVTVSELPDDRY